MATVNMLPLDNELLDYLVDTATPPAILAFQARLRKQRQCARQKASQEQTDSPA